MVDNFQRRIGYNAYTHIHRCDSEVKLLHSLHRLYCESLSVQVNSKATLMFSNLLDDQLHENIIWPELPYVTDEHGSK